MNTINIFKIVILVCFISIQIYHISTDHFVKYPCLSWGNFMKTPLITLLWVIIIYFSVFIMLRNNVIKSTYIWLLFTIINILIIVSNFDYSTRKSEGDRTNVFSYIHHFLSFITLMFCYLVMRQYNSKFINIFILILLIVFFSVHQLWYIIQSKQKKQILKDVSTIIELVVFCLILGKGITLHT